MINLQSRMWFYKRNYVMCLDHNKTMGQYHYKCDPILEDIAIPMNVEETLRMDDDKAKETYEKVMERLSQIQSLREEDNKGLSTGV